MFDFLFGKTKDQIADEYNKAISDTKQSMADSVYQQHYNKALYDANKNYFDSIGVKDPASSYWDSQGNRVNALSDTVNQYGSYLKELEGEKDKAARQNKYNIFGSGLIGGLLNPFHQVGTAAQDFVTSGTKEWQNGNRDLLSDIGALGEVGLTVAPIIGSAAKLGKGAVAGAKTLGQTIGKGAAMGGAYGLTGGLREMGGKDFDLGQLLTGTAVGAGVGGALSGAGYGLGKAWNKYSQPAPSKSTALVKYGGGSASTSPQLQEYMNTLGVTGDNLTEEGLKSARNQATKNIAKTVGYESTEGQAQRTAINNAYQELLKNLEGKGTAAAQTAQYVAPKTSFVQKLKNVGSNIPTMGRDIKSSKLGRATSKALSTKKGKVAAGVGGGLLLSQLLSNKGQSQPTQQELDELYNYIYGG